MELDDLKKNWKQHIPQKITNRDIMELIHHKSYGPIAALKKAYRKQMVQLSLAPFLLLLLKLLNNRGATNQLLGTTYLTFVALCIAAVSYIFYNYRIVNRMEGMVGMVKENLEQQIDLLDRRMKNMIIGEKWLMLLFVVTIELVPYFLSMPDKWLSVHPIIRIGVYGLLIIYQNYYHTRMFERRYGQHVTYLKNLVKEMQ